MNVAISYVIIGGASLGTNLAVRSASEGLKYTFIGGGHFSPPRLRHIKKGFQLVRRVEDCATEDSAALMMEPEDELSDDTEVRTSSTDSPEQIRVLLFICYQNAAVCDHDGGL